MATKSDDPNNSLEEQATEELLERVDQTISEVISRNGWIELQASQISEDEFEEVARRHGMENDEQTRLFTKFLALATNFSSGTFTERLQSVPKVVKSITDLLEEMRREVAEFADVANEFEELVHLFGTLVIDTQHKMGMILPHMYEASDHIGVLADVFKPNGNALLTAVDQDDVKIAVNGLLHGMQQMIDLSRASSEKSRQLSDRITQLKTDVQKRRGTVKGRIHVSKALSCLSPLAGAGIVARAIMALTAAKYFGGAGVLVVAGATFSPITAIVCGALLGGSTILAIAALVYHLWTRHQFKALAFLDKICTGLMELANANAFFLDYLNKSEEVANTMTVQLEQIQRSITSERYRARNANLCEKALETIGLAIQAIENIRNIDVSRWLAPQHLPHFDESPLALTAPRND
jgi:hypothetical protein